jgi:leucyl aminopeptidase
MFEKWKFQVTQTLPQKFNGYYLFLGDLNRFSKKKSAPSLDADLHQRLFGKIQKKLKDVDTSERHTLPSVHVEASTIDGDHFCVFLWDTQAASFDRQSLLAQHLTAFLTELESEESPNLVVEIDEGMSIELQRKLLSEWLILARTHQWKIKKYTKAKPADKAQNKKAQKGRCEFWILSRLSDQEVETIKTNSFSLGVAINRVRTLAEMPANELTPVKYRSEIEDILTSYKGIKTSFLGYKDLKRLKAGAFLAVAQAAGENSGYGILRLTYKPAKKLKHSPLALVGKGICFDTGGYNVKTGNYMLGMNRDMTGSAVALSLLLHLADTEWPGQVDAYLALAENHISPTAFKMNDIVYAMNGLSIEIIHTDAEGRMVLADTLTLASQAKPELILDFATLTGACVYAFDQRMSGVFSTDESLGTLAVTAGRECGERVWPMPLEDDFHRSLESKVADLKQCHTKGAADHIYAACFLSRFMPVGQKWLHVDLASENRDGGLGLIGSETTGFGVRFAREFLDRYYGDETK